MSNLSKMTQLLSQHYCPLDVLAYELNTTPTAILMDVQKLKRYGIPIEYHEEKGFHLAEPMGLLDNRELKRLIKSKSVRLELLEAIDSTNDYLKSLYHSEKMTFCVAELQTGGKGRMGKSWHSAFGKDLTLSFLKNFKKGVSQLSGLSMVVSLAVCKAIEDNYNLPKPLTLKWPNDILCQNKKLGGVLIEIQADKDNSAEVIVGIGLNVNSTHDTAGLIDQPWTSLALLNQRNNDRNLLCAAIINTLVQAMERFEAEGFSSFVDEWKAKDALFNQDIELTSDHKCFEGKALGVNENGQLILQLPDQTYHCFSSGNTSLAKSQENLEIA